MRLASAHRLQWRDRAGIAPASESTTALHYAPTLQRVKLYRVDRSLPRRPLHADFLSHEERQLQRLARIEPRVAIGVVAVLEAALAHRSDAAAGAFGHVVAGHLDVDATGIRPHLPVHLE